jgi:hypothetical protein
MRILRPLLEDAGILWSVALLLLLVALMLLSASASIMDASTPPGRAPQWIHVPTVMALVGFLLTAGAALGLSLVRAARALAHRR